ncbi:conserved hypothetical protein [Xanthomonas phaseoli pv. phaseoli]|nr:conserved hypothetical protein [Xanthomonas phaseoli pv. phaseoli]SOO30473.1 conserved hypothetical protein [Xanthomonas phaseoli pv. phaseoli]
MGNLKHAMHVRVVAWLDAVKGFKSKDWLSRDAASSPLAGHAVNPSVGARLRNPCRHRSRKRRGHRARQFAGCLVAALRTDHCDWSLPAYRRGTLRGMDAA